jgi:probable addiction module antidote protein
MNRWSLMMPMIVSHTGQFQHSYEQKWAYAPPPALLAAALGDIAKARGMTQLARDTGLCRESLYKSLSGERAPSSDTLFKVIHAMGFKLTVEPLVTHG